MLALVVDEDTLATTRLLGNTLGIGLGGEHSHGGWALSAGVAHRFERPAYGFQALALAEIGVDAARTWRITFGGRFVNIGEFYGDNSGEATNTPAHHLTGLVGLTFRFARLGRVDLAVRALFAAGVRRALVAGFSEAREVVEERLDFELGANLGIALWAF